MDNLTAPELWATMWPEVPFSEASPEDRKLLLDHANSLRDFNEWKASRNG